MKKVLLIGSQSEEDMAGDEHQENNYFELNPPIACCAGAPPPFHLLGRPKS